MEATVERHFLQHGDEQIVSDAACATPPPAYGRETDLFERTDLYPLDTTKGTR